MKENKEIEFEQYKLFMDSAEKNSDRRISQNNIYLTINLAFLSYIIMQNLDIVKIIVTAIVGILMCILWFFTIDNYSKRNKVKFQIINESMYGKLYKEEYKRITVLTGLAKYEKVSSVMFIALYIAIFIINLL